MIIYSMTMGLVLIMGVLFLIRKEATIVTKKSVRGKNAQLVGGILIVGVAVDVITTVLVGRVFFATLAAVIAAIIIVFVKSKSDIQ